MGSRYCCQPERNDKNQLYDGYGASQLVNMGLIPKDVLWRMKEGMSDGVSSQKRGWFEIIQEHVESKVSNITTNWSAQAWGPELIARDIGANFFDGCVEAKLPIDNVKI